MSSTHDLGPGSHTSTVRDEGECLPETLALQKASGDGEAFIEFIVALRHDSPDLRFTECEMVIEGNRVESVFTMTRTHRSEEGHAKLIATEGMDLFHVVDGRIPRSTPTSTG